MAENTTHILVVDDDRDIRQSLASYLGKNGMQCSVADGAKTMDEKLSATKVDLVVLDVMMPGEDGFSICRRLQETTSMPIILLTALADETDRIVGLELGADDYLTKPFNPRELLARIKSVLRRSQMLPSKPRSARGIAAFSGWQFDFSQKEIVASDGVVVRLSSSEHLLLVTLIDYVGTTLSREQLLALTKGRETQLFDRSVDNQISRLRRKLEVDPKDPRIILTEWGGGYRFSATVNWVTE